MGIFAFKLPDIGEGIAEAELVAWHVRVGDMVEEDGALADVMTDKATVEMTSPVSGKVVELGGEVGDRIAIGSDLAIFETGDGTGEAEQVGLEQAPPSEARSVSVSLRDESPSDDVRPAKEGDRKILASPAVRQRAKTLGIDLAQVRTAEPGRVRHADLDAFLCHNAREGCRPAGAARADQQIRVTGLRRRIAENMAAAKRAIPHFTYVEEIDVTKLEGLRADLNATRGDKPKLTMLPLLITAVCRTLPDFRMINARYDDEAGIVTRSGSVHLGVATRTDAGLVVPVIRNAESRNIWQLAAEIGRLTEAARNGKARPDELTGSTLTITSLGPLGGIATTPVINRPEVAIIAPNKIVERPVIRDGRVVAAKLMNLSISCDHRVVDGWDAASFVQAARRLLETPALLFVD